ncbi:MAG: 30S ribosomal protein S27e [Euryarchaeota archaeon]|jgi:small subunit ribosomal protein S27e|uniref:Small ribosomal subunit protein eS27 n=1 Tax=uncultured marine group II/III euryarchaeote KM3_168_D03 TaxID=1457920 RepID=A0A075GKC8_9EURY|nr:Ribosomal protein S27E [uncultured marine group II/III euryarchaeote KM3_168_D03]MAJ18959.1 30S ribosomal protein S27e [Euryarchaeota archaeon]MDC0040223.1 30S ribosomal protein S27e [Candidatus Poseidoniales archaeon]MDC0151711.1 30S ribosomal protein S27e [bacterium]MDP6886250.1 30S ribosomal protein S27e [Candidatus Thalassarchaeaceae archaeon]
MGEANFLRVNCRDCGHEAIIFERASTSISCSICGATLARPAGGKAQLVGSTIVDVLE